MNSRKLIDPDLDVSNAAWLEALRAEPGRREPALGRLHELLLRAARTEANRRLESLPSPVRAEVDDLCFQAADDAMVSVLARLESFRGDSRFTTWVYAFAIFEISTRLRRHAWRGHRVELDRRAWDHLVDLRAPDGQEQTERREQLALVRDAATERLSDRQRLVFEAVVLQEVPVDVVAERLESTRGAVYKTLHDARRKLRAALADAGYVELES